MLERIFQLLAGHFDDYWRGFVLVQSNDVANGNRTPRYARLRIQTHTHRNIRVARFQLHALNQIENCRISESFFSPSKLFVRLTDHAAKPCLRFAMIRLGYPNDFRIRFDLLSDWNRAS